MRPIAAAVLACALAFPLAATLGCGSRPAPPPPAPVKPASLWSSADSQAAAKQLVDGAVAADWVSAFHARANRPPKIAVLEIQDRSNDHVDVGELAAEIEKDLAQSQQVTVVADRGQADFVLAGAVAREAMTGGYRYSVDLRVASSDGDPVWPGGIEREIKTPPPAPAVAPVAPAPAR